MTVDEVLRGRLRNQYLADFSQAGPVEVVNRLGVVQAQDFRGARWAVIQRAGPEAAARFDADFAEGRILRTHILRPTWHFVSASDIRWMLDLSGLQIIARSSPYQRQLGISDRMVERGGMLICNELQGGTSMTRKEISLLLSDSGHDISNGRLSHYTMFLESQGLVCSGPLRDGEHSYALLSERAPHSRVLLHEAALAELARRFFTGHGPATLEDFLWWSGLNKTNAKAGIEAAGAELRHDTVEGNIHWFAQEAPTDGVRPTVRLLPNFDEYLVGYVDRSWMFDNRHTAQLGLRKNPLFENVVLTDGIVTGTWKPIVSKKSISIEVIHFRKLNAAERTALDAARELCVQNLRVP